MEYRQVRAFLAVAEEGSITAAAKRLRLTQPALSRQIKALEEELGVELLARGAHSVSVTPAGEILVRDGSRWVSMAGQIADRVKAAALGDVLRIAYAPSLAGGLLGRALERFSQLHPRVRVQFSDCSTVEMKSGLVAGDFDLILTVPETGDGSGICWERVEQRSWMLAVGAGHRLAESEAVKGGQLDGERLLMFSREEYPDYWRRVTDYCREQGVKPRVVGEFDGFPSLATAVESGMGVALMAAGSPVAGGGRMRLLKLDPEPEPVCVAVGWHDARRPEAVAMVLVEELRRAAHEG